jgi:hypothetical protein
MNPSAAGWIKKLITMVSKKETYLKLSVNEFYSELKHCGFIYGNNVDVIYNAIEKSDLTSEELSKINLLLSFHYFYKASTKEVPFIESVINFYSAISASNTSAFDERICGAFANPEELAYGRDGMPAKPLYRVRFTMPEIWGEGAGQPDDMPADTVDAEIFEHWLEPG